MATLLGGRGCVDPSLFYTQCVANRLPTDKWLGRANLFALTAGREPGRGAVLLRKSDLDALDLTKFLTLKFLGTDRAHEREFQGVTLLSYECLSPGAPDDADAVYLCELVDQRHFFGFTPLTNGYRAYNVTQADGAAYQTATLNAGTPWTWQQVVTDLTGQVGAYLGTLTLPFTPYGRPENLIYTGTAWAALNDLLARLACVIGFDSDTGVYAIVRLGVDGDDPLAALEKSPDYLGRTWDGYSGEPVRAWRPQKIRVRFLRRPQPTMAGGESPYHTVDITLSTATGVEAGTVIQLDDDLTAVGATGAPSNTSSLATRAQERADDWLRAREKAERPFVRAWRDIQPSAVKAVGRSVSKVVFDDRGGEMQTWAVAVTARDLEAWRPLGNYPPWWPFSAGGSLTVEEVDGAPSLTGVTKIQFDQADGFAVSQPAPGVARIDFTSSGSAKSVPCKWLQSVKTASCWTAYRRGGRGQCDCWGTDDIDNLEAGGVATYVAALSGWLVVKRLSGDWPMVKPCCGCGSLLFKIDPTTFEPSLTLGGVHVSCDSEAVYTKVLTDYVCYELPDGRRVVEFFGFDSDAACNSDTDDPCANEYRIAFVCGADCPPAGCGCEGCGGTPTPIAWRVAGLTGFSAASWNGDWVWRPTASCTWSAPCGENTSTLTYVAGESPVWRLTHGGSVYEVVASGCSGAITLTRVSGSDSPTTITLTPVPGAGSAPTCCSSCNIEPLKSKTLYLSIAGVPEVLSATYDTLNNWWYFSGVVTGCTCMGGLFEAFLECVNGKLVFSVIPLCPCKGAAKCAFGAFSEAGDYYLTVESCDPFFASGQQYLRLSCATNPTTPVEFTLSEVAP